MWNGQLGGGAGSGTPTGASAAAAAGVESPGLRSASTAASPTGTRGRPVAAPEQEAEIVKTGPIRPLSDGSMYTDQSYISQSSRLTMTRQSQRGSCASSSYPHSAGHGTVCSQRRFNSRHVPGTAEDLVHSPEHVMTPEMVSRFNGLMRHLKSNSEWDEQQKQVMVSNVDALVPEELEDMLQGEFARRCSFGDRMNTELMSSFKWVKTLQDCGAIINFDDDKRGASGVLPGAITRASADMIFIKVLHDCDYGGKRLTYDLFCKALYLVSRAVRPDLPSEGAFSELLARIASVAPEDPARMEPAIDFMLDASVIGMLDHFKPALHDVFNTFCNRGLDSMEKASPGSGTIRLSERTFWKHTQDSRLSGMGSFGASTTYGTSGVEHSLNGGMASSPKACQPAETVESVYTSSLDGDGVVAQPAAISPAQSPRSAAAVGVAACGGSVEAADKLGDSNRAREAVSSGNRQNAEADAGGGYAEARRPLSPSSLLQPDVVEPIYEDRIPMSIDQLSPHGGPLVHGSTVLTSSNTMYSGYTGASQDPYLYARGKPVIRDRRRHMSVRQMENMCKDLQIMPDLLSRLEIVRIFKRAQCAGSHNTHGSSLYGYLNFEAFLDAAGQLALEAYSKSPYNEEYPEPQEKILAFFLSVLPSTSREVNERFLYGCSGRGR